MIFFSVAFMQAASGSQFSTSVASTTATLSILGVAAITGVIYWLQHRKRSMAKPPTQWKPVGKVEKLFLYPLKSGNSISLDSAECTLLGLRESSDEKNGKFVFQDRFFLIYQEGSQKFLTARQKNQTLVITATSNGENEVTLSSPNCDYPITFKVPSNESEYKKVECSVHSNEIVDTVDCGDEVASWLSKVVFDKENSLRLGYHVLSPSFIRHRSVKSPSLKEQSKVYTDMTDNDLGAYSDIASYMVLSQESVVDLNKRLEDSDKITDRNFRPNIVVSGCNINAYDEDGWQWLKIGDEVIMKGFKPCTRCLMVTLDPVKGVANPTKEPLLTLKKYRQVTDPKMKEVEGTSPVFGRYFGIYKMGNISVGDAIYVPV